MKFTCFFNLKIVGSFLVVLQTQTAKADVSPELKKIVNYSLSVRSHDFTKVLFDRDVITEKNKNFSELRMDLIQKGSDLMFDTQRVENLTEENFINLVPTALSEEQRSKLFRKYNAAFSPKYYRIFIKTEKTDLYSQSKIFLHEAVHAYQYLFRMPLDLLWFKQQGYTAKNALDYLAFHYEAEAHWFVYQLDPPLAWQDYAQGLFKKEMKHEEARFHVNSMTFGLINYTYNVYSEKLLPVVDQLMSRRDTQYFLPTLAARYFSFPVVSDSLQTPSVHGGYNLNFHRKFSLAIKKAYDEFNLDLRFFQKNSIDQKNIYRPLVDHFVQISSKFDENQKTWILNCWQKVFATVGLSGVHSIKISDYFVPEQGASEEIQKISVFYRQGLDIYQQSLIEYSSTGADDFLQREVELPDPETVN